MEFQALVNPSLVALSIGEFGVSSTASRRLSKRYELDLVPYLSILTGVTENCAALLDCCRQIRSPTLLDFKHDLGAYKDVKIDDPRLRFCPVSQASPLGIELEDDVPSASKQPLHIICQSLVGGSSHQLRRLTLDDGNLLRFEKLLPVFMGLQITCPRDGQATQYHWDWAVESNPAPFAALKNLRERLSTSHNIQAFLDECANISHEGLIKERSSERNVDTRTSVQTPSVEDFATWLLDDRMLAERAYLALERGRKR